MDDSMDQYHKPRSCERYEHFRLLRLPENRKIEFNIDSAPVISPGHTSL